MCLFAMAALPAAMAAVSVAGTALTAISTIQQGSAQRAALDYNAKVANMQALDAERRGSIAEGQQRQRTRLILGAQRAEQGASGVVPDTGSGLDVLAQTAEFGARDAAAMRENAKREAWGYRTQAHLDKFQSDQIGAQLPARVLGTSLTSMESSFEKNPWWHEYLKPKRGDYGLGSDYDTSV